MSLRALTWTVVVLAAVVLASCDDKDVADASNDPTTTLLAGAETTEFPKGVTSTTTPIDFDEEVAELEAVLDDAEGDLCALVEVTSRKLNVVPADPEQAHTVVDLIVKMVESMGRVVEPGDAQHYEDAADRLEEDAEEKDYDPEWLTGAETFKSLDDPEFFEASGRLQARYQEQCTTGATTPG